MLPFTNIPQQTDALKYNSCTKQVKELKMPCPLWLSTKDQKDTINCFWVFDSNLISKFCTARNIFLFPESFFSCFIYSFFFKFLKAVSFSCYLQLLTPVKCSWLCRKSKGTAAVSVKVNLYTAKLEALLNTEWQAYQLEWMGLLQECCQTEASHLKSTRVYAVPKQRWVVGWEDVWLSAGLEAAGWY